MAHSLAMKLLELFTKAKYTLKSIPIKSLNQTTTGKFYIL
jgi:hypothetical protein